MSYLKINQLTASFENNKVLKSVSFEVKKNSINCFVGPSGSGKTTLLRCIAGFHKGHQGEIHLDSEVLQSGAYSMKPEERRIGVVFQDFALFPHLNVVENILFGIRDLSQTEQESRLRELVDLTNLRGHEDKYPHELSGGQQQRVAIARALAPRPRLLLLDEPFSHLDPDLREKLIEELQELLQKFKMTAIIVTHHQEEAFQLAENIGVLFDGELMQWASAYALYHRPINKFVADFVGNGRFLPAKVLNDYCVETSLGRVAAQLPPGLEPGSTLEVLVRPDDVSFDEAGIDCLVKARSFRGPFFQYRLELPNQHEVLALLPSHINRPVGEHLPIRLEMKHLVCFSDDSQCHEIELENLIR